MPVGEPVLIDTQNTRADAVLKMAVLMDNHLVVIALDGRHTDAVIPRDIRIGIPLVVDGEYGLFQHFRRASPNLYSRQAGVEILAARQTSIFVASHS